MFYCFNINKDNFNNVSNRVDTGNHIEIYLSVYCPNFLWSKNINSNFPVVMDNFLRMKFSISRTKQYEILAYVKLVSTNSLLKWSIVWIHRVKFHVLVVWSFPNYKWNHQTLLCSITYTIKIHQLPVEKYYCDVFHPEMSALMDIYKNQDRSVCIHKALTTWKTLHL